MEATEPLAAAATQTDWTGITMLATAIIAAIGSAVVAVVQAIGKRREARVAQAVIRGVEAVSETMPRREGRVLKGVIRNHAEQAGVQGDLAKRVERETKATS